MSRGIYPAKSPALSCHKVCERALQFRDKGNIQCLAARSKIKSKGCCCLSRGDSEALGPFVTNSKAHVPSLQWNI